MTQVLIQDKDGEDIAREKAAILNTNPGATWREIEGGWELEPGKPSADFNGADPAKFDHDKDGKPGGSKAKGGKK